MQARACLDSFMNSTIVEIGRCTVPDCAARAPRTVKKAGGVPAQTWAHILSSAPPGNALRRAKA